MDRLKILIANDDGIDSPGILRLAEMAAKLGDVWVAAPSGQCSGMSQKLTIFQPIEVERVDYPVDVKAAYSVGGTPADCVKLGITALMPEKPDFVFSGINKGYNVGYDIAYSGTMGAAMEALLNDVPAIAFSTDHMGTYDITDIYLEEIARELIKEPVSLTHAWNVNFPGCAVENYKGILRDRTVAQTGLFDDNYSRTVLESGKLLIDPNDVAFDPSRADEGSDMYAVVHGYISIGRVKCMVK